MASPSLRQQAYVQILAMIESGELPRGAVTSEVGLSQKLDMSRTPVRAALQQLELEGYVRIASKHGVIVLDSSSQRVGDLLEMIASMALFAVSSAHTAKTRELSDLSHQLSEAFNKLRGEAADPGSLIAFEFTLLQRLIALSRNVEMDKFYRTAASRLFWHQNSRRWRSPYSLQTDEQVTTLIRSIESDPEAFRQALFGYLSTLKMTWR